MAAEPDAVPTDRALSFDPDDVAPDGSLVRLLAALPSGGMAHFELGPGEVSLPQRHRTVSEIWYVLSGTGRMWRAAEPGAGTEIELRPGVSLTIPVHTAFQFRNTATGPLTVVGVTMPPWPGPDEAVTTDGPWTPTVRPG